MTYTEFVDKYKPIVSPYFHSGTYDNILIDKQELFRVESGLRFKVLWTMIEIFTHSPAGDLVSVKREIRPGMEATASHIIGYIMTEIPYDVGNEVVTNVPVQ